MYENRGRGSRNVKFTDYLELEQQEQEVEMEKAKEGNAPSYSIPLETATDVDESKKMIEKHSAEHISHGHNVNPTSQFGRKSIERKNEEPGGKPRFYFREQQRVSKFKEFLFEKTLTSIDCKDFFAISTKNALAHFPSLQISEFGDFSAIETLDILHLQSLGEVWRMDFIYSFDRKSYGISTGWNEFVSKYNLKSGVMVIFYKSTNPAMYKQYYIDCVVEGEETTETEDTATSVEMKTIRMYGFELNYLFEKELTPEDVKSLNLLEIPTQEGTKHFSSLSLDGTYFKEENLFVFDAQKVMRQMQISLMAGVYFISGSWNDFVSTHKLHGTDVIRFFKIINNGSCNNCYLIDYVKAEEVGKKSM